MKKIETNPLPKDISQLFESLRLAKMATSSAELRPYVIIKYIPRADGTLDYEIVRGKDEKG